MTNSASNEDYTDSLNDEQDEEAAKILKIIESVEDVHKTYRPQSAQEMSVPTSEEDNQATCSTSKSENKKSESYSDSDYTSFLKHMSVRYSHYRMDSGEVTQQKGQTMDYRDYSYSQFPVGGASCSWQSPGRNGQDFISGDPSAQGQMESPSCSCQEMPERESYYSYGQPLPKANSVSDETIVNQTTATTSAAPEDLRCSTHSCNYYCPLRQPVQQPGQQPACYSCDRASPGQEQLMHMPMPMGIDPNTGYPFYCYSPSGNYPGTGMCSMPAMQMEQPQRGGVGQHNVKGSSSSASGSPSSASMGNGNPTMAANGANQSLNSFDMEAFMQKYQQSLQQCYATAQQGLQQYFANANANAQPYFNNPSQGAQQYYANSSTGTQQMFASSNQATAQYYDNSNQEPQPSLAYQGMPQTFSSPLGAQPFYTSSGLGAQQFLPPSMPMPASSFFGNNTGFISDTVHTQTVYSSDYKSFANEGNHFNHFPNGMNIGLTPDSCPGYGQPGPPVLAEMGAGGQAYGMGGDVNMSSYPLSQMSYSSPYSYEMPSASTGYYPGSGVGMVGPKMQAAHPNGGNPSKWGSSS